EAAAAAPASCRADGWPARRGGDPAVRSALLARALPRDPADGLRPARARSFGRGPRGRIRRCRALLRRVLRGRERSRGRAALVIVFVVARVGLVALLQAQAENTVRAAVALADLVLSPLLFLGAALLYFDQAARVVDSRSPKRRTRDADLHPAVDADRPGRADAEVQP